MTSTHVSRVLPGRTAGEVYGVARDLDLLPHWAHGLAEGDLTRDGDRLVLDSPMGRVQVRFAPLNAYGVLDHDVTLPDGTVVANPLRVLPHPDGAELVFTLRPLGRPEAEVAADAVLVAADLERLEALVARVAAGEGPVTTPPAPSSDLWDEEDARTYDDACADLSTPQALGPTLDLLEGLAEGGSVLELAVDTGRVAIPLAERGLAVSGIELSAPMIDRLHEKRPDLPVVVGDMATATAPGCGTFSLVYLVFNTIGNLRTQAEQVACFANAARHLRPGGRFVVELWLPPLRKLPPGQEAVPFDVGDEHLGFDTYDVVTQQGTSHHYTRETDGRFRYGTSNFRYVWPAELDLMAALAGLTLERRTADFAGAPYTGESTSHVSVWRTAG
ncbi:class I SAM-dependent DNA methyltransferase [Lapillicoccus jejuensis]|uniref:Methyltransferase family protein n=1 Tax=Lapillicoccus jejuensis TaxID=402171 RepID=A0A542DZP1_9MICO|nr:methyltransferase family protein [Lapillicoccus jejuensis]